MQKAFFKLHGSQLIASIWPMLLHDNVSHSEQNGKQQEQYSQMQQHEHCKPPASLHSTLNWGLRTHCDAPDLDHRGRWPFQYPCRVPFQYKETPPPLSLPFTSQNNGASPCLSVCCNHSSERGASPFPLLGPAQCSVPSFLYGVPSARHHILPAHPEVCPPL